jgi:hypothetical protein
MNRFNQYFLVPITRVKLFYAASEDLWKELSFYLANRPYLSMRAARACSI